MFTLLYTCLGLRRASPNPIECNTVTLYIWQHAIYNPSGHLGLCVRTGSPDAQLENYFSLSPKSLEGIDDIPPLRLRDGRPARITDSFAEEKLIWGCRRHWAGLKYTLNQEQKDLLPYDLSITKISDETMLQIAGKFDGPTQRRLISLGEPNDVITLKTLDVDKMKSKIEAYKNSSPPLQWAALAGTYAHPAHGHNCASVVLSILYAGGMDKLVISPHAMAMSLGIFAAAITCFAVGQPTVAEGVIRVLIGAAMGIAAGGIYEGCGDIQPLLDTMPVLKRDSFPTIFGLRLLCMIVTPILSIGKIGHTFPAYLTMPKQVVALAQEAQRAEDHAYKFVPASRMASHAAV